MILRQAMGITPEVAGGSLVGNGEKTGITAGLIVIITSITTRGNAIGPKITIPPFPTDAKIIDTKVVTNRKEPHIVTNIMKNNVKINPASITLIRKLNNRVPELHNRILILCRRAGMELFGCST